MKKILLLIGILFTSAASANYGCTGKVAYLGIDRSGSFWLSNGYGIHRLCSLNEEENNGFCRSWLTQALSAQAQDRSLVMIYRDTTGKESDDEETCRSIGNWVTPSDQLYFIRVL